MQTEIRTPPKYNQERNERTEDIHDILDAVAAKAYEEGIDAGYSFGVSDTEREMMQEFRQTGTFTLLVDNLDGAYRGGYIKGYYDGKEGKNAGF